MTEQELRAAVAEYDAKMAREMDALEIQFDGMDGDAEHCCGHCGEDYLVSRNVSVSYSTSKLEPKP